MSGRAARHLDAQPLTRAVGVEIRGVDAAGDLDDATIHAIRAASFQDISKEKHDGEHD